MRNYHPDFVEYQRAIAAHPNYATLPNKVNHDGEITWVKVKDSARTAWWEQRRVELGLTSWAEVARTIFPTEFGRLKPCQQCGRKLSIDYVYPNKNSLKRLNDSLAPLKFTHFGETIFEIVEDAHNELGSAAFGIVALCFGLPPEERTREQTLRDVLGQQSRLSPGVMSNPPDRLDGFHSDNGCHRSQSDKGRHKENMQSYVRDRRAFENWADGDWCGANALMGAFRKASGVHRCPCCGDMRKMTADHVGPISLGFTHRMNFNPLCGPCNSRKQNSMTLGDIRQLKGDEASGEIVISWHSKYIWDELKDLADSNQTAERVSQIMSLNMLNVLWLLSQIAKAGHFAFLEKRLNFEFANWQFKFTSFDASTGRHAFVKRRVSSLNSEKQKATLRRIAEESLRDFAEKNNRRIDRKEYPYDLRMLQKIIGAINQGNNEMADTEIEELLKKWSKDLSAEF